MATPVSELKLTLSEGFVQWESAFLHGLSLDDQWGYKIAVSGEPCPQRECNERDTEYFEVQRLPTDPQRYVPYSENLPNLHLAPEQRVVWVGVAALPNQGEQPFPFSEEVEVPVVRGAPGDPAPSLLLTVGDTVFWGDVPGASGYKVAVSRSPRCEVNGDKCRVTQTIEVAKSGEGTQSFSPCLEDLDFKPIEDKVYVGVGTLNGAGTNPVSYTGSEVAVSVPPCPKTVVNEHHEVGEEHHEVGLKLPGPKPPVNSQVPSLTGTAAVGYLLTVGPGGWQNDPNSYTYQWQICNAAGAGCQNVSGATSTTFPLTGGDFEHRLRVAVTAQNSGGTATALSGPSPVIGSTVDSEVEWSFAWGRSYTIVEGLGLHAVTPGAHVEVVCRGARCPFKVADVTPVAHSSDCHTRRCSQTHGNETGPEADLAHLFKKRHLRPGTVIIVRVTKPGWVGRFYTFTVRANQRPSHPRPTCLAPDSTQPSTCSDGS